MFNCCYWPCLRCASLSPTRFQNCTCFVASLTHCHGLLNNINLIFKHLCPAGPLATTAALSGCSWIGNGTVFILNTIIFALNFCRFILCHFKWHHYQFSHIIVLVYIFRYVGPCPELVPPSFVCRVPLQLFTDSEIWYISGNMQIFLEFYPPCPTFPFMVKFRISPINNVWVWQDPIANTLSHTHSWASKKLLVWHSTPARCPIISPYSWQI